MEKNRKHILKDALETDDAFSEFLKQAVNSPGYQQMKDQVEASGQHPPAGMLHDYVLDDLDEKAARHVRDHLLLCHPCTDEVLRLMQIEDELEKEMVDRANEMPEDRSEKEGSVIEAITSWISQSWEPQWAGQPVTAADIPEQEHLFRMDDGEIRLSCFWREARGDYPTYIRVAWEANITSPSRIEARFTDPETREIRAQVCLGTHLTGEKIFTSEDLGFNPSREKWTVAMILTADV